MFNFKRKKQEPEKRIYSESEVESIEPFEEEPKEIKKPIQEEEIEEKPIKNEEKGFRGSKIISGIIRDDGLYQYVVVSTEKLKVGEEDRLE